MPRTLDELVKLSGVGRKTASVVLGAGFGLAEGVVVDTHVGRISRLLGLTSHTDPVKVEQDLMAVLPRADWIGYAHLLIDHGRSICVARRPKCGECFLAKLCPSAVTG
jgi:endonuclease-3